MKEILDLLIMYGYVAMTILIGMVATVVMFKGGGE